MDVEWDDKKASSNLAKHGGDFADAVIVFHDELAITVPDDRADEFRFVTLGSDALGLILVVVFTWRRDNIRVISARRATKRERRAYEGAR